jgi:hypothetical protein
VPGWFEGWRAGHRAKQGTGAYVASLMSDPEAADVEWLAREATGGDSDRATWELRYLRRALGLLIAQRDAMDDRTGSSVAHQLALAMAADRNVAAPMVKLAERQFNERLAAYREMMHLRGSGEDFPERIGRALLLLSGSARVGPEEVRGAGSIVSRVAAAATEALGRSFGAVRLPDDVPPSAVRG